MVRQNSDSAEQDGRQSGGTANSAEHEGATSQQGLSAKEAEALQLPNPYGLSTESSLEDLLRHLAHPAYAARTRAHQLLLDRPELLPQVIDEYASGRHSLEATVRLENILTHHPEILPELTALSFERMSELRQADPPDPQLYEATRRLVQLRDNMVEQSTGDIAFRVALHKATSLPQKARPGRTFKNEEATVAQLMRGEHEDYRKRVVTSLDRLAAALHEEDLETFTRTWSFLAAQPYGAYENRDTFQQHFFTLSGAPPGESHPTLTNVDDSFRARIKKTEDAAEQAELLDELQQQSRGAGEENQR